MLLNSEELLALVNGDAEPDRLADLLDRLERCPESTAALQVLVTLRAHREEALETLRLAAEQEHAVSTPEPATIAAMPSGWALQGLRLAASVALAAMIGVWALSAPVGPAGSAADPGYAALATSTYENYLLVAPPQIELTSSADNAIAAAGDLMDGGRYRDAIELLRGLDDDRAQLFLGMAFYFTGDYAAAAATLEPLRDARSVISRQAKWFEANSLLQLERPWGALLLLEDLQGTAGVRFRAEAHDLYVELLERLRQQTPPSAIPEGQR